MSRKLVAILLATVTALFANGETEYANWYTWTYRIQGDSVEILGVSPMPIGALTIPSSLGGKSVASIKGWTFFGCSDLLTSVTIPYGVTNIGDLAFDACRGLVDISLPASLENIGRRAFSDCGRLKEMTIPNSVTNIGDGAFERCSSLTSVTIGDGVTNIGGDVFSGCSSLTSVTIPDNVANIGDSAFDGCSSLTSVTIGGGVTNIGRDAFSWCSGLTSVTIPDNVVSIGYGAFYGCRNLTSMTIGSGITDVEGWLDGISFDGEQIKFFSVSPDNPCYKSVSGLLLTKNGKTLVKGVTGSVNIPSEMLTF